MTPLRFVAVEHALDALAALSEAVAECADARTVRDIARITGLPRQTVHRWRIDPPGAKRLAQVRESLRDAGCGQPAGWGRYELCSAAASAPFMVSG